MPTSSSEYDVIVIGLGAMGSAAAYHLVRRGQRVLGIEQFTPAHAFGSSHGATRIVRQAYFERPDYVPLLRRTYELWDELSADFGEPLFERCGALMIGLPDSPIVAGTLASAQRWSLPHEVLDAAAMRGRFSQFALPDDQIAVFEANAGFARAEASVLANIELAIDLGADLWFDTEVESVELGPGGVYITAADETLVAPKAVIATGAWAPKLANLDQYSVAVTRQTVHWFDPVASVADFLPDKFPVFVWDWPVPDGQPPTEIYGFPYQQGDSGVKVGLYRDGTPADPDTVDRTVTDADASRLIDAISVALPTLAGNRLGGIACMYAGVQDNDFVLGIHPGSSGRVVLAVGFAGHGFKFAPVVGEIVSDLVIDSATRHEIGFLAPTRLAETR
ncbi:MAG TPA: N-methyl-L-tryptophan oxidase [Jatrophihabitans sp.]|jgi:sarcosine oxidase